MNSLASNICISPLPRYAGLCLYSFLFLHRAEPSVDCEAQTRLYLVVPTSSPTFYLPAYLRFWLMDNTWHARGTKPCLLDPRLQNVRENKLIFAKYYKIALYTRRAQGFIQPTSNMPRISSGVCGWSGCSEAGSGKGVFRCGWPGGRLVSARADPSYRSLVVIVVVVGSTSCSSVVGARPW